MWSIVYLLGFAVATPSSPGVHFAPINQFSLKLLDNVYAFQESFGEKNVAISPLSVWSIFSLLAEGSAGDTFLELMKELQLPNDLRSTQALHAAVANLLKNPGRDVTLRAHAAMFSDHNLKIHGEFCESANYYNNQVYSVDPRNATLLARDINSYVCVATEGHIRNAVQPKHLENLRMVLVDALYFKASWTHPFDPTLTKEEAFYNWQGKTSGSVNMMYHKAPHNIADSSSIGAQILEMTYGEKEEFSMVILLPFDGMPLKTVLRNLASQPLSWMADFKSGDLQEIECYIPRFKITTQIDLIPPLQYSGVQRIFDAHKAQLPGVSDSPLHVSQTVQNAAIEVTEEGTVAASSTVVGLEDRILGQRFEANKEFVFLVSDRATGLILFAGVYAVPQIV